MSKLTVQWEWHGADDGEPVVFEFPGKRIVCDDCDGEGSVLTPSIRNHCYSAEEFQREFYDDRDGDLEDGDSDADHYFRRGGKYDVVCPTCKGKNVITVIDEEACDTEDLKDKLAKKAEWDEECYQSDLERAAERRMGA